MTPLVSIVGAGPGDPELLTLRAARRLAAADVVLHDRLVDPRVLALCSPRARMIDVGKSAGDLQTSTPQAAIHTLLVTHARLGARVVRLKGGDPFVFGRGGEEALALAAAGIPFEIVPGISAGIAAPAAALIPVTHRAIARTVTFATATTAVAGFELRYAHLAGADTLVVFMAGGKLADLCAQLIAHGRAPHTPAAAIVAATCADEQIVDATLATLPARADRIGSPALLVIGDVVAIGAELRALAASFGVAALVPHSGRSPRPEAMGPQEAA